MIQDMHDIDIDISIFPYSNCPAKRNDNFRSVLSPGASVLTAPVDSLDRFGAMCLGSDVKWRPGEFIMVKIYGKCVAPERSANGVLSRCIILYLFVLSMMFIYTRCFFLIQGSRYSTDLIGLDMKKPL